MKWEKDSTYVSATDDRFIVTFTAGMRWSYPYGGSLPSRCSLYGVSAANSTLAGACPDIGTLVNLGAVTYSNPTTNLSISLKTGTGPTLVTSTAPGTVGVTFNGRVDKFIPAQDLVYLSFTFSVLVPKNMPQARVSWTNNARLSTILETNNDTSWLLRSTINHIAQRSPEAVMNAVVPVDTGVLNTLTIPTYAEPGSTVQLSVAPASESLLNKATPTGFSFSNVSPNTVNFTPPANGLYAVQLTATSKDAAGNVLAQAPFEFLLSATTCISSCKRVVMNAPSNTTVEIGDTLTFPVNASAQNIVPVAPSVTNMLIDSTPLPSGMNVSPGGISLPGTQSLYTWTPTADDLGSYPVCFQGMTTQLNGPNNIVSKPYCVVFNAIQHNDPPLASCSAPLLNLAPQSIAGTATSVFVEVSDPDLNALTVSWKVNGNAAGFQTIAGASGTTQIDLNFTFPIGVNTVEAIVDDGFTHTNCTTSVSVDKLSQAINSNLPPSVAFGSPAINVTALSASGNPVTLQLTSGPATLSGTTLAFTGVGEVVLTATANGNANYQPASATLSTFVVDAMPPTVTVPGAITVEATSASGAVVAFAASANDDVDGATATTCVPAAGSTFPLGGTLVTCTSTDTATNTGSASFSVSVVDTTAPAIAAHGTEQAEATSSTGAIVVYAAPETTDAVAGPGTAICTPASGSAFAIGLTPVTCVANDGNGNTATSTFDVAVHDTTPPSIAPVTAINVEATSAAGAVVTYTTPDATDLVDGAIATTCAQPSGSTFPVGSSTVTCTATDSHGNVATSAFAVTVGDATAPAITTNAAVAAEATSASGAAVTFASPTASDLVDGVTAVTCSPVSGSTFALGNSTVTCSTSDAHGNSASSSFTVTVQDTTGPVIAAHAPVTGTATSALGGVIDYAVPATTDAVDGAGAATCVPASHTLFAMGDTIVTCSAVDAHGNAAVATTFTVSVTNNAPTFTAPANIVAEAASAAGAAVTFSAIGHDVEDGNIAAVCTAVPGSTFPIGTTTVNCTVTDVAGATAGGSFTVTVRDTTAPVVAYSGNAGTYDVTQTVNITCAATDAVGVVSSTCAPVSGPAYTFAVGANTFSATARDAAGNIGSGSTTFTVVSTLQTLQQLVVSFCDNPGICNALNAKLSAAASSNATARRGQLGAFENQVRAQTGKCLTPAEAAILLQLVSGLY